MAIIKHNNAEGGTNGSNATVGNSGGTSGDAWGAVNGGTGVWTYTNSPVAKGSLAYACTQASGTAASLQLDFPSSNTAHYGRVYVYHTGFATGSSNTLIRAFTTGFGEVWRSDLTPTGQIRVRDASLTTVFTSTQTISLNTWYHLEWHIISGSGTSGTIELNVYPGDSTTPFVSYSNTACNAGASTDFIQFGPALSSPQLPTMYVDEMVVDDAAYPGPANTGIVTFDALYPGSAGTVSVSPSPLVATWSHTCSGANRAVVVGVVHGGDQIANASIAITYDGAAMTQLGAINSNNATDGFVELFGLVDPPTGTKTVIATCTSGGSTPHPLICGSISFNGVNQTTPFGTAVTAADDNSSGTNPITATVSSAVGDMVIDVACYGSAIDSSNQTLQWLYNYDGNSAAGNGASSTAAGAPSVTMGYTTSKKDWWGIVAVDVRAATAPSGGSGGGSVSAWLGV